MYWRLLIPCFSFLVFSSGLYAAETENPISSPSDSKIGWWWYEVKPPEETDPEKEEKKLPSLSDYSFERLWNMHPDQFQGVLTSIHKKAVMTLKEEDVRDYLVIQDIARRKAHAYTNVNTMVVQKYPKLSLERDFPTALPGRNAKVKQQMIEVRTKIEQSTRDFALIYFYSPSCHFCAEQNKILQLFQAKHPWNVKPINITQNPKLAEKLQVHAVPYLLLLSRKSKETMPIAAGVISLAELEKRLHRGIRLLNKETNAESYSMYEFQRGGGFDATAPLNISNRPNN